MGAEIRVAGFTLTADEWDRLESDLQDELLGAAGSGEGDDDGLDASSADVLW